MAPKNKPKNQSKAAVTSSTSSSTPASATGAPPPRPAATTIAQHLTNLYQDSRPYQTLFASKSNDWTALTPHERTCLINARLLDAGTYRTWDAAAQKDFLTTIEKLGIPWPLEASGVQSLGKDRAGRWVGDYSLEEYKRYEDQSREIARLREESTLFRLRWRIRATGLEGRGEVPSYDEAEEAEIQAERERRVTIGIMENGKKPGRYASDPAWDDVTPIPQDDGQEPLAAIAYTDEYAEAISYLRAITARNEHSPRVLTLTAHIITLNPAHYTVWLYRFTTIRALGPAIHDTSTELAWLNEVALQNQKNYQIWHHRQQLMNDLYPSIRGDAAKVANLARNEIAFLTEMFEDDAKNYHVWSYRQYLVRQLGLFPSQTREMEGVDELGSVEALIEDDVRNNSAWSHRFFIVFSDPAICAEGCRATETDTKVPRDVIEREVEYCKVKIRAASGNASAWGYLRGVVRKGGWKMGDGGLEEFVGESALLGAGEDEEVVESSQALEYLADLYTEKKERSGADMAFKLLGDKYDPIRRNYWEWRRADLKAIQ